MSIPRTYAKDTENYGERTFTFYEADGTAHRINVSVGFYNLAKALAHKAISNKSKRAKLCHGAIVVKAVPA